MSIQRIPGSALRLLAATAAAATAGTTYSGKVLTVDSAAKAGVVVVLKRGESVVGTATSSATGAWSLEDAASVRQRASRPVGPGSLFLDGRGALRVRLDGHDASGRIQAASSSFRAFAKATARATGDGPDTLVYSEGDRVLLRDTLSAPRDSMLRIVDTTWNAAVVYGYLPDVRDGKVYRTVRIGNQLWMAENLAHKVDSSWVTSGSDSLGRRYGRLYHWSAAMAAAPLYQTTFGGFDLPRQGVCPAGWHLPSDAEWSALYAAADSAVAGTVLKAVTFPSVGDSTSHDSFGFRALPGGILYYNSSASRNVYTSINVSAMFWTSTEIGPAYSGARSFSNANNSGNRSNQLKTNGHSVRCIRD